MSDPSKYLQSKNEISGNKRLLYKFPVQDLTANRSLKISVHFVNNKLKKKKSSDSLEWLQNLEEIFCNLKNSFDLLQTQFDEIIEKNSSNIEMGSLKEDDESKRSSNSKTSSSSSPDQEAKYITHHNSKCPFIKYICESKSNGPVDLLKSFQKMLSDNIENIHHNFPKETHTQPTYNTLFQTHGNLNKDEEITRLIQTVNFMEESKGEDADRYPLVTDPSDKIWRRSFQSSGFSN